MYNTIHTPTRTGGLCGAVAAYKTYLYEQLNDRFHDIRSLPVHPDHRGHISHVQVPLVIDKLVEDAESHLDGRTL